jgi:penicillin-binding protein 2
MPVNPQQKGGMIHRFTVFVLVIALLMGTLVVRLWLLQVVQGSKYEEMSSGNRIREIPVEAQRGYIMDRNGRKMVVNRLALSITATPDEYKKMEDREARVAELAELLGMQPEDIAGKLEQDLPQHEPVLIKKDIDPETWFYIRERQQEFAWVQAVELPVRDYPAGEETRAAHVLGYLGEISKEQLAVLKDKGYKIGDIVGTSGVEAYYEDTLRGRNGVYCVEVDAHGRSLRRLDYLSRDPEPGNNLVLTIDRDLQKVAEESLRDGIKLARGFYDKENECNYPAPAGAVVVLDPRNGEVLALASEPTFNLSEFVGGIDKEKWAELNDPSSHYPLNNRAIVGQYPPGSTFKPITALAALQYLGCGPYTPFYCSGEFDEGEFKDYPKRCWGEHGSIDLRNGIVQSCDVVFYSIGYSLYGLSKPQGGSANPNDWNNLLQNLARLAGLGSLSGIDLPNEFEGRVPTPQWKRDFNVNNPNPDYRQWYPGDTVNLAVGQGDILVTPLQLADVFAALANGGPFYRPHVGKEIFTWEGESVKKFEAEKLGDLTDPGNPLGISLKGGDIQVVREALTGVVKGKGTAASTFAGFPLELVPVAGKTGTAEMGVGKSPTAWFACYAPADDPQYVIVVMVENGGHGGMVAAPVARRILEHLYGLPYSPLLPSQGD